MLPLNSEDITADHIASLVENKVAERKVLEYKEQFPGGSDGERKEFLADVCSFANTSGGDIIYGIRDARDDNGKATGVPDEIIGLSSANLSIEQMEAIIRDGIKPRIPNVQIKSFEIEGKGLVVLLRIGKSWIKPHMVTYRGTSRFFARHSTGKYQLDVQEIGQAFSEQRVLGEQLRNWRTDRVATLLSEDIPVALDGPARLLLHFIPATALAAQMVMGPWPIPNQVKSLFRPSNLAPVWSWRYNADGFLVYSLKDSTSSAAYVPLFRNGCLEYVDGYILNVGRDHGVGRGNDIPSKAFEEKLVQTFGNALLIMDKLAIEDPVYFMCTMVGVQGRRLSREGISFYQDDIRHTFDRQIIQTPEIQIDRGEQVPYCSSLLPIVNSIWQACGYEQTPWLSNWGVDRNR